MLVVRSSSILIPDTRTLPYEDSWIWFARMYSYSGAVVVKHTATPMIKPSPKDDDWCSK